MKNILILGISMLCMTFTSAQWGKKIKGNGNVITENRDTGSYDAIHVAGFFDVELIDGKEGKLTLKGEENLLKHIITEVKDGKLVIKVEKGLNLSPSSWKQGVLITVPIDVINAVTLSGSGDIAGKKTIESENFSADISGSGDINLTINAKSVTSIISGSGEISLRGATTDFDVKVSGSGDVKAYDLATKNVTANISGSADIEVTATEMIKARVSGSGDISYRGNPKKIDTKSSGSGDISKV
ncbi:head GIN domain-containing protein [Sediminicola sp. 1XM1-17]|uniref:head GIN domain-containing protein n=1 Tax=Sediminicola sp. 1XM1-17 TaxID=3127702 RepID=UPI0030789895